MLKNKDGFTLIELLGVITILGILSLIIIPQVNEYIENGRTKSYDAQVLKIKNAANDWALENTSYLPTNNLDSITITLGELKHGGYIGLDIMNPSTEKSLSNESQIIITKNGNTYEYELNLIDLVEESNYNEQAPTIILNGSYIEYVEINEEYEEKNGVIKSNNGILSDSLSIQIKSNNIEVPSITTTSKGTYQVIYSITKNNYQVSATRTVIIRDTKAPEITGIEDKTISTASIAEFNRQSGVLVKDNSNEVITPQIEGTVGIAKGQYVIKYTATDSSGNKTEKRRVITVE